MAITTWRTTSRWPTIALCSSCSTAVARSTNSSMAEASISACATSLLLETREVLLDELADAWRHGGALDVVAPALGVLSEHVAVGSRLAAHGDRLLDHVAQRQVSRRAARHEDVLTRGRRRH